jgi:hypothetical protein
LKKKQKIRKGGQAPIRCIQKIINLFFPCRNRLENNTEHWNALLLSLRELIEWVIRKDTELTGLGPIRGDLSTLVKQQVNKEKIFHPFIPTLPQEKCILFYY